MRGASALPLSMSVGNGGQRNRHVVLDAGAVAALSLRHGFTQLPHGLRLRQGGGEHGILDDAGGRGVLEFRSQEPGQVLMRNSARPARSARTMALSNSSGFATPVTCFTVISTAMRGINSNEVS